jgi:hypothetical protein
MLRRPAAKEHSQSTFFTHGKSPSILTKIMDCSGLSALYYSGAELSTYGTEKVPVSPEAEAGQARKAALQGLPRWGKELGKMKIDGFCKSKWSAGINVP